MIFEAVVSSKAHPEYGQATIPLPIPDDQYDSIIDLLEAMDIGSPTIQDCRVDELTSPYPILTRLVAQIVNVDELDYLSKRLESFCRDENAQFQAMASKLCLSDIKDLINLTFCCQQTTVITDFSNLEQTGKGHALTVNGGSMPMEEFDKVDGRAVALDLIQSGAGVVTPYGVVYDNGMKLEQLYDGQHFPEYLYENSLLVLELSSRSEPYEAARLSWLYFPMPDSQIQRTMLRAGISGPEDIRLKLVESQLPQHISGIIDLRRDDLNSLNELCRAIAPLEPTEINKLEAVVLMTRAEYVSEVRQLAENLDQFDFVPKSDSPETDSALTELGYVAYHGNLTLEELMRDDPAELCQREQGMGGDGVMDIFISRGAQDPKVRIRFPAEPDIVWPMLTELDEYCASSDPARIVGTSSLIPNLTQHISCADVEAAADIRKLNVLAEMVDGMSTEEQRIFSGALRAESINGLDDALSIASSLGRYELIEGVTCDKELGGWLVEHGKAGVDFPKEVWPYLDYAGIGAEYYASHGGAYTPDGYVKRREIGQTQKAAAQPTFALTLVSPAGSVRLDLPTPNDKMEQAKQTLGLDSLDSAVIGDVEIGYPWAHLLPMDSITLEDANSLAQYVSHMDDNELRVYGAALEVEEPSTFSDAVCIAENIDLYELVSGNEGEYGREALRYAGAGDEILEMLDGFTDFDALGRSEMEADGVRETSFGCVRRLSAPWPRQEPEAGQTMC